MPFIIKDNGQNNLVDMDPVILANGQGTIVFEGDNNVLIVASPVIALSGHIHLGGGSAVEIGRDANAASVFIYAVAGSRLTIGKMAGFNGLVRLLLHEKAVMSIGDGCLFASDVDITVSDMHSIIDCETSERINPARDVTVGNRVWIGQRSIILKGAKIGDGSIIGANSTVSSTVPANCIAAGNPARLLRVNVTWDHRLL